MGLLTKISRLRSPFAPAQEHRRRRGIRELTRQCRFEQMETRVLLAADPLVIGAVYIEEDLGADTHGDTFEVTFEGGADGTQLTRVVINGDKNEPGPSVGDAFFDAALRGLGADDAFAFGIVSLDTQDESATVTASVIDGEMLLVLDFAGFQAGDKLVFTIDVDEVQEFDPGQSDLELINEGFDPVTSGIEFQGSTLTAHFAAPHYFDVEGVGEFRNRYDANLQGTGLDLSEDNVDGKRDRTAGAVLQLEQLPRPVTISGTVYLDHDLDLTQDVDERGLQGVTLSLWKLQDGAYVDTTRTTTTDQNGDYRFGAQLNLLPGTYQVREVQPADLFSVGAVTGSVDGLQTGSTIADNPDMLTEISIPLGDQHAVDYDFAEARAACVSGYVYHDRNNNGLREEGEEGIAGVEIQVVAVDTVAPQSPITITTDADGFYDVCDSAPGTYRIVEAIQPEGFFDGLDSPGTVDGVPTGVAENPGDNTEAILLLGGSAGTEYNFGELAPGSISGFVYHDQNNNGLRDAGEDPIAATRVLLLDSQGNQVAEQTTDADGFYQFSDLRADTYTLVEIQPAGWLDGSDSAGTIDRQVVGAAVNPGDEIGAIDLDWSHEGVQYNFGELLGGSIAGFVHADPDQDCFFDAGEEVLTGVTVQLLDADGNLLATTQTDVNGRYEFSNLTPGTYSVRELQPEGYFHGGQRAGSHGGDDTAADLITDVSIGSGQQLVDYNFCELPPSSLSGFVHADPDQDCTFDPGETGLAGVTVQLLDAEGNVVATTETDAGGRYQFEGLAPGQYSVREFQPEGYFHGGQRAGSAGGDASLDDLIGEIMVGAGQQLTDYNFCELPPSSLSGFVHVDPDQDCTFDPGETGLAGVTVQLLDADGNVVATTQTDAGGRYQFEGLAPGQYSVREFQPEGYFHGGQRAGSAGGDASLDDLIGEITVGAGQELTDYNFCELPPSSLSGFVHADPDQDCTFDPGETGLAGVTIQLLDADGNVVATTQTDAGGRYQFEGLAPGHYSVREFQPEGYFHGGQRAGSAGGDASLDDLIGEITVGAGQELTDYSFCELPPSSLSGFVHADPDRDCTFDPGEAALAGVTIQLLDTEGNVLAITQTDAGGRYEFDNLRPGQYSVREFQPADYFHGGQRAGSADGDTSLADLIGNITVGAGQELTDYNFCELPPSNLSGHVFQDGPAIQTTDGEPPEDLAEIRDGRFTPDDIPLVGVVVELRNGINGEPIDASVALPGYYSDGPIRTTTDANGFYQFSGLPSGNYAVYQVHPDEYIDGIDTPGLTSGIAVNPSANINPLLLSRLSQDPQNDAIILIPLATGASSVNNNFSEVLVTNNPLPLPPADPPPSLPVFPEPPPLATVPGRPPLPLIVVVPLPPANLIDGGGGLLGMTWHLSVIDAGMPRGEATVPVNAMTGWTMTPRVSRADWSPERLREVRWDRRFDGEGEEVREALGPERLETNIFGMRGAIPVSGDFDGDGVAEIGVYYQGQWFLDVNGNGRWDEEDLWALLGSEADLPVTGDWDGDGKDDIGIFGPEWPGDPEAIQVEPGLPDRQNIPKSVPKNMPPQPEDATFGHRVMQRTAESELRADLIDHVFRYGVAEDVPISGDWNGDGIDSVGVFRDGRWYFDKDGDGRWSREDAIAQFGRGGDIPVVGDFNGDGIDEIGVFRGGKWTLDDNGNRALDAHDKVFELGGPLDRPIVGDWDGDGVDEPGVCRDLPAEAPPAEP